jgi:hypothetical protein
MAPTLLKALIQLGLEILGAVLIDALFGEDDRDPGGRRR